MGFGEWDKRIRGEKNREAKGKTQGHWEESDDRYRDDNGLR